MDLRSIEAFVRVAELGSITRASRELGIVQPALSRHIQRIETEIGIPLLVRLPRGVQLTIAGRRFLRHARRIMEDVARATEDLRVGARGVVGEVSVGVSPTLSPLLTPGLLQRCAIDSPRVAVKVVEEFTRRLQADVANGRTDVALLTNPPPAKALQLTPVLTEPMVIVTPAQARGVAPVVTLEELSSLPVMVTSGIRAMVDDQLATHGVRLLVEAEIDSVEAIRRILLAGRGASVLPISAFREETDAGRLASAPVGGVNLGRTIVLAHLAGQVSPAVRAVVTSLRAEIDEQAGRGVFSAPQDTVRIRARGAALLTA
jgi:LysR family nitrogen assimilation transcriptional regulator